MHVSRRDLRKVDPWFLYDGVAKVLGRPVPDDEPLHFSVWLKGVFSTKDAFWLLQALPDGRGDAIALEVVRRAIARAVTAMEVDRAAEKRAAADEAEATRAADLLSDAGITGAPLEALRTQIAACQGRRGMHQNRRVRAENYITRAEDHVARLYKEPRSGAFRLQDAIEAAVDAAAMAQSEWRNSDNVSPAVCAAWAAVRADIEDLTRP